MTDKQAKVPTVEEVAAQVPNAGSGSSIVEGQKVVIRSGNTMVWAQVEDGVWKIFDDDGLAITPSQTAPEVARALVLQSQGEEPDIRL